MRRLCLPDVPVDAVEELVAMNSGVSSVITHTFLCAFYSCVPLLDEEYGEVKRREVYAAYQRRRHANNAGVRIHVVPVLEYASMGRVMDDAVRRLRECLKVGISDPSYPGEAYCFIKGMLQFGLRDKNLLREEDEFFLADDEWDIVAYQLLSGE
jgi:hypothetical protein